MLRIRDLREAHKPPLTQEALAHLAGISVRTVARAEARGTASQSTLRALAAALRVKVDHLFEPEPERVA